MHIETNAVAINNVLLKRATYASVAVASVLVSIKLVAYFVTDSVALLSSFIDSALDLLASAFNLFAVRLSLEPADDKHRFGHGKAEPLAGLAQAAFISGSAIFLCFEAVRRMINPVSLQHGFTGMLVMLVSIVLPILLVLYQRRIIARTDSVAIKADAFHYVNDIAINFGVIVALVLTINLGWVYADPVIAIFIVLVILRSVWHIGKQSVDQLMDKELPQSERDKILEIVRKYPRILDAHDLRTRASGQHRFIQIHLEFDGETTLAEAHSVAEKVERQIISEFPGADVIIHQDPV